MNINNIIRSITGEKTEQMSWPRSLKKLGLGLIVTSTMLTPAYAMHNGNTTGSIVSSFESLFGVTKGKRRNHTKGFCFDATLIPHDKAIQQYSSSVLFSKNLEVIGRLSHKGGNSDAADDVPADYGMSLAIATGGENHHLMSMNTLDFFPVATPEAFAQFMIAKTKGGDAVKAFKNKSPDLRRFKKHQSTKLKTLTPYEGNTFNSINSFYLLDAQGKKTAVRWSFIPSKKQKIVKTPKHNFFFENMQENLKTQGVTWDMVVTLANPNDIVENAAIPWKGEHKKIIAAKLKVKRIQSEQKGSCDRINYDPMVLSEGFAPSADPLLQARRNAYALTFSKRIYEQTKP